MKTRGWIVAVALVGGCTPAEVDEGLGFGFGSPPSACSGDCVEASDSSGNDESLATTHDEDSADDSADGSGSSSSSTGVEPVDGCPADAECHFDADCISSMCVDCACLEPAGGDTESGTTGGPIDGPNADPYGACGQCQAGEQELLTTDGCVCSTSCTPFIKNPCPSAPGGFPTSCFPVGGFETGRCALECDLEDPQCPEGASCQQDDLGYTVCSFS